MKTFKLLSTILLFLFFVIACSKSKAIRALNTFGGNGSWTFIGYTDTVTTCTYGTETLGSNTYQAVTATGGILGNPNHTIITCLFNTMPTTGTYTITHNPSSAVNTVTVLCTSDAEPILNFISTASGTNQNLAVSVINNKINIMGTNINMSVTNLTDTESLSFNVTAQY